MFLDGLDSFIEGNVCPIETALILNVENSVGPDEGKAELSQSRFN